MCVYVYYLYIVHGKILILPITSKFAQLMNLKVLYVPGACGGPKRMLGPVELELQKNGSFHVSAGN